MYCLRLVYVFSLAVLTANSFRPLCDPKNQFRFYCYSVKYCNYHGCRTHDCGYYETGGSGVVWIKNTSILPTCAFAGPDNVQHIIGRSIGLRILGRRAFVDLTGLDSVDLSFNLLTELHKDVYENVSVTSLDLSWNRLMYIEEGAFSGFNTLKHLNLSKNELITFPIYNLPPIQTLNLSWNNFSRILLNSRRMSDLKVIDLSYNKIKNMALSFDEGLTTIDVAHNNLIQFDLLDVPVCDEIRIAYNYFSDTDIFKSVLIKRITLFPNLWLCDYITEIWNQFHSNRVTILDLEFARKYPVCLANNTLKNNFLLAATARKKSCSCDKDCPSNNLCRANICLDPCQENICDATSNCNVKNHRVFCSCPAQYIRDPRDPYSTCQSEECFVKDDCRPSMSCLEKRCLHVGAYPLPPTPINLDPVSDWWEYEIPKKPKY